ncbi:NAD(P)/FAD-dependent oxidoreductase [Humidesulfovibrio sp.]
MTKSTRPPTAQPTPQQSAPQHTQPSNPLAAQPGERQSTQIPGAESTRSPMPPAQGESPHTGVCQHPQAAAARPLTPRLPLGRITAEQLEAFACAMRRYAIPHARLTSGQRLALPGVRAEDRPALLALLGLEEDGASAHGGGLVQACPGAGGCKNALADTQSMALRLEALLSGLELPAKVRAGVSGCPRCCAESRVRDVGLIGGRGGWTVVFGGNAGAKPRAADELGRGLDDDAALALIARALARYAAQAGKNQRTARFVDAAGIGAVADRPDDAPNQTTGDESG